MFLMIENEVKDDNQFKECIEKIHQNKARLLESVNFMKALESQWLCLGAFYSYDGTAQCNCDACNNFAITSSENISQKLEAAEKKVEERQTNWKPNQHIDELTDILRSSAQKWELDKPKPPDDLVSEIIVIFTLH